MQKNETIPSCNQDPSEVTTGRVASLATIPVEMLVEVMGGLEFAEFARFVDQVVMSNSRCRDRWEAAKSRGLRVALLDNREYSIDSVRWVISRGFRIFNFSVKYWGSRHQGITSTFHWACFEGDLQLVRAFINFNGESSNTLDKYGDTSLHWASEGGHVDVVNALLAAGAGESVNTPGSNGNTPLHCASERGHVDVVDALLAAGAISTW